MTRIVQFVIVANGRHSIAAAVREPTAFMLGAASGSFTLATSPSRRSLPETIRRKGCDDAGARPRQLQKPLAASAVRRTSATRSWRWQPARRSRKSPLHARALAPTMSAPPFPAISGRAASKSAMGNSTPYSQRARSNRPRSDTGIKECRSTPKGVGRYPPGGTGEAEQERADHRAGALLVPAEAGDQGDPDRRAFRCLTAALRQQVECKWLGRVESCHSFRPIGWRRFVTVHWTFTKSSTHSQTSH